MTNTTRLDFEATTDLVERMHAHPAPLRRRRVGAMEIVSGMVDRDKTVALVIDGVTGESVRLS